MTNPPRRNITHGVLSERYHLGGRVETDTVAMAAARQEQAGIQRRHHLERRHGDDPSQTPSFSSLVTRHEEASPQRASQSADPVPPINPTRSENQPQLPRRGRPPVQNPPQDGGTAVPRRRGQLLVNPSLPEHQPQLPRRGRPPVQTPPQDGGTAVPRRRGQLLINPSLPEYQPELPRRGRPPVQSPPPQDSVTTVPGRRGGPPTEIENPTIPRRGRPRDRSPDRQLRTFDSPPPVFSDNMQESPLSLEDTAIKQKFDSIVAEDVKRYCLRCKERWFDIQTQPDDVCKRCHQKDDKKRQDEPFFYSAANHLDFGDVPTELPQLEPIEEMLISRVHVSVSVYSVHNPPQSYLMYRVLIGGFLGSRSTTQIPWPCCSFPPQHRQDI